MNRILQKNLDSGRLFLYIDMGLQIHLGVADKFILLSELTPEYTNFTELWRDTVDCLWNFGYRSEEFITCRKQDEKNWWEAARRPKTYLSG